MTDPNRIGSPSLISFSGGRTSAFMLRNILDAHDGKLPNGVKVAFANTGKERNETLDFVHECDIRWGVGVVWLEYAREESTHTFRITDYANASRDGSPFADLIAAKRYLPNPVMRFCTTELKVRVIKKWMMSLGYETWNMVLGLRADEPWRVSKAMTKNKDRWSVLCPMATAGHTVRDVMGYWAQSPFDLALRQDEGNCDLCFLKGAEKISRLMRERPESVPWWAGQESTVGATFRTDRPSYANLLNIVQEQGEFDFDDTDMEACHCTD